MNQQIFSDVDLSVQVMPNLQLTDKDGSKNIYNGIVFQVNCQDCETPTQLGISWGEVRILLDGGAVGGVQRVQDGWIIAVQCQNEGEGCKQVTQISISDEELERYAAIEVARRKRVAMSSGGRFPGQQPQPQQVARRPLPRQ